MEYKVILSPEKGFWSERGWVESLSSAVKIPSDAHVVLSFKDDRILLIRRRDITVISKHALISLLVKSWIIKNNTPTKKNEPLISLEELEKKMIKSLWEKSLQQAQLSEMSTELLNKLSLRAGDEHFYLISLTSPVKYEMLRSPQSAVTVF